jgi:hypothetical protein
MTNTERIAVLEGQVAELSAKLGGAELMALKPKKLPWNDLELERAERAVRKGDRRAVARYLETHERKNHA